MTRRIPPDAARVRFSHPAREDRYWWRIEARGLRCAACVRQSLNRPDGVLDYTIVDLKHGIPGTCRAGDCRQAVELVESHGAGLVDAIPLWFGDFR